MTAFVAVPRRCSLRDGGVQPTFALALAQGLLGVQGDQAVESQFGSQGHWYEHGNINVSAIGRSAKGQFHQRIAGQAQALARHPARPVELVR